MLARWLFPRLNISEHTHMVDDIPWKGQVLLGDEIHDVEAGDFIEIPGKTIHQFRANKGDYIGFLCLVNQDRDKVKLLTLKRWIHCALIQRLKNFESC